MASLMPRLSPIPYPSTHAATTQPRMNSQIRLGLIIQCHPNIEPTGIDFHLFGRTIPNTTRLASRVVGGAAEPSPQP